MNHQSVKYGGHKSCGSGDKKVPRYDYVVTKCDNSLSYTFIDIFLIEKSNEVILLQSVTGYC